MTQTESIDELRERYARNYDVYARTTIAGQLDELAERREQCPITFSPNGGFWLLTRYDDMSSLLRKNNRGVISFPNMPDGTQAFGQKKTIPIELDGPIHSQYRKILEPLFSPARVAELEPRIRQVACDLIDDFIGAGECDFIAEFALPLPGTIFLAMMGWPVSDAAKMNNWVNILLHGIEGASPEEVAAARGEAAAETRAYMNEIIAARRAQPTDDITSIVLQAQIDGAPIPDDDLYDLFVMIMMAGLDTVQSVLGQSMVYFARHQAKWDEMFSNPAGLDAAIEELVRWCSPALPTRNIVYDSLTVGELELPKGERVYCPLGAGNRDPKYYPNPNDIVFDREPKPHLSFGLGPHRCLGVHLARTELRIAFEELHRRLPSFRLSEEPHDHIGLTWGVGNVQLSFDPA
jgi:cytochrome P450